LALVRKWYENHDSVHSIGSVQGQLWRPHSALATALAGAIPKLSFGHMPTRRRSWIISTQCLTFEAGGKIEPGDMATGIGPAAGEANSLRLQPPPALIGAVPLTAGRDDSTREEDAVGVGERAPGGDAAHDPRARASEGDSGDLPVSGPLAGADQRGDGGDPSRPFD